MSAATTKSPLTKLTSAVGIVRSEEWCHIRVDVNVGNIKMDASACESAKKTHVQVAVVQYCLCDFVTTLKTARVADKRCNAYTVRSYWIAKSGFQLPPTFRPEIPTFSLSASVSFTLFFFCPALPNFIVVETQLSYCRFQYQRLFLDAKKQQHTPMNQRKEGIQPFNCIEFDWRRYAHGFRRRLCLRVPCRRWPHRARMCVSLCSDYGVCSADSVVRLFLWVFCFFFAWGQKRKARRLLPAAPPFQVRVCECGHGAWSAKVEGLPLKTERNRARKRKVTEHHRILWLGDNELEKDASFPGETKRRPCFPEPNPAGWGYFFWPERRTCQVKTHGRDGNGSKTKEEAVNMMHRHTPTFTSGIKTSQAVYSPSVLLDLSISWSACRGFIRLLSSCFECICTCTLAH